ncbi:hypothetical protein ML462_15665 [Gramella lutea]|uniref:Uncharacterized protein n=1 Tax=Christiangramia lutea TaxID=1607951 RepID=A0A9X1V5T5_9FLAO|nr:hypothetical protein [Christiangramia lutea]MCH4824611.1 hypothetical protein [Christiangramia lutea]
MTYTREKLQSLNSQKERPENYEEVVQELANKVFDEEKISLAEEHFVCGIIENLRNKDGVKDLDIFELDSCENYLFRDRYLIYFNDLNGYKPVFNFNGEIPLNEKNRDVAFLQKQYEDWKTLIAKKLNGTELINYVSQETNSQLKEIEKYCSKLLIGSNRKEYLKKSIILHGKYIFLLVKEFYQELGKNEEVIELNGKQILIDSFTYVHTMFRHFAQQIKHHQENKSYHFDENIGFKTIPNFLSDAIKCFKQSEESDSYKSDRLYIIFNEKKYAIWFRPFKKHLKGNRKVEYLRVQTFYPITNSADLEKLSHHKEISTSCGFRFLKKNAT